MKVICLDCNIVTQTIEKCENCNGINLVDMYTEQELVGQNGGQLPENVRDMFWVLLQDLEHKIDPQKDLLDKRDVETGYRIWNKIYNSEHKPNWNR